MRWIVERIVDHEDPPHGAASLPHDARAVPPARKYLVRWLGFSPEQDTWEPCVSLLREVADVVLEY